jgi:DNA-binding response OmpR family regulator
MAKKADKSWQILVVEDDDGFRELIGEILENHGYQVLSATDGRQAVALAMDKKPDLILLDLAMPQIDGWDVLRALRMHNVLEKSKVCIMTGLESPEKMNYALQQGAAGYIVNSAESFSVAGFLSKVQEILEH